ncbi:MAG: FGGY family carbohydrate kinase [Victivallales bacterium]|nr:FGGY family carbohydrate kinase [Victivallales bacterium]
MVNRAEKQTEFLIGLDLGTSAIKGICMGRDGRIVAEVTKKTSFIEPVPGRFEINPEDHYREVCEVIKELAAKTPGKVVALAMAAASGNTLLTTAEGKPLTNIISWLDRRTAGKTPAGLAELSAPGVRQVTGWPCIDSFPLAHLAWLRENRPELYEKAGHYCMNTDWLGFCFTGKWRMDHSTAATFHLQDQISRRYYKPYLQKLGIPEEKLSKLMPSGKIIGNLTPQAAADTGLTPDTVLVAGSFDHPAAARAGGILEPGQILLSCGTSWVGFFPEHERQKIIDLELLCDPFLAPGGGPWGAIFSVPYIGRSIDWYVENLIAPGETDRYGIFNELAAKAKSGAGGLKIDLRQPPGPVSASRGNLSRALMEGAAELLNEKIKILALNGIKFNKAVMVGGPSKSPIWPRIVGEITNIEVITGSLHAGAKGAAVLAGTGAGIYK